MAFIPGQVLSSIEHNEFTIKYLIYTDLAKASRRILALENLKFLGGR
ncbi:hypothetical protein VIBNISOn1_190001 [Vibrio nigripulchritudo SOn1]|uniref:Uncharacterized protein n=1 Tax=Vibrio nigripulchritudo SOn1 TaxID=1238450 RepID=A0AAV2VQ00_9VIBR|nr:hypothetical protein VIBNISOn1_190001 [Vibrio nigripulchritudo SOn1]